MAEVLFLIRKILDNRFYAEWNGRKQGSLHRTMPHWAHSYMVSFARLLEVLHPSFLHWTQCLFLAFPSLRIMKCPVAFSGVVVTSKAAAFIVRFLFSARLENPAMSCFASAKRKSTRVLHPLLWTFSLRMIKELTRDRSKINQNKYLYHFLEGRQAL